MQELFEWDDNWRRFAECGEVAPWNFGYRLNLNDEEVTNFKKLCETSDVQEECLEYAFITGQTINIWGGLTDAERRNARQ